MNTREPLHQIEVAKARKGFKVTFNPENRTFKSEDTAGLNKLLNDTNVIAEKKEDGHRFKMHICENENRFDSRREAKESGLYVEKTDNAPHIRDHVISELVGTVLDGEFVFGANSGDVSHALGSHATEDERVKYVVFDIIYYKGEDVRNKPDKVRRELLKLCFARTLLGKSEYISLIPRPQQSPEQKRQILLDELSAGREGIMLKDVTKPYGKGWIKVKKTATYDVIVMGYDEPEQFSLKKGDSEPTETKWYKEGWIGAIRFGQYVGNELTEFGKCSGIDDELRKSISENREKYLGRAFEITAYDRYEKTGKFRHPNFNRWREDKPVKECVYRKGEL